MKVSLFYLAFCVGVVNAGCQYPRQNVIEEFRKVDESLGASDDLLTTSVQELYSEIINDGKNGEPRTLKADTVYYACRQAAFVVEYVKWEIEKRDTSGENLDVAPRLLIGTSTGDSLSQALAAVYLESKKNTLNPANAKKLDSVLKDLAAIQDNPNWQYNYFHTAPSVAALTILSKLKNDCTNATIIALSDIKERLR